MPDNSDFIDVALYEDGNGRTRISADDAAKWLISYYHVITDKSTGTMYYYDGAKYSDRAEEAIKQFLEDQAHKYLSRSIVSEILEHIRRATYDTVDFYNPGLINLDNGVWDIEQAKLRERTSEYMFDYVIPVPYVAGATCPKFIQFLEDITEGDEVMQVTLLEAMAYSLIPGMPIQRAIMLVGEGSNGKSTFLGVLRALLGPENVSHATIQSLNDNRFAVDWLRGKLANIAADLPSKHMYDTGIFKALTGGDPVPAERKNVQRAVTLKPGCKLYFSANQIPDTPDDSDAFYRRWLIIEFKHRFPEGRDILPELTTPEELTGILSMLLEGFVPQLWRAKKFSFVYDVNETRSIYQKRSNTVKAFAEDRLEYDQGASMPKADMYQAYVEYCDAYGLIKKSEVAFWRMLKQLVGIEEYRPERGMPAWVRGQKLLPMPDISPYKPLHKDNKDFLLSWALQKSKRARIEKMSVIFVQNNNPEKDHKNGNEKPLGLDTLSGSPTQEAQNSQSKQETAQISHEIQNPNNDTQKPQNAKISAVPLNSVQIASKLILTMLRQAPQGLILGSKPGNWDLLYPAIQGQAYGLPESDFNTAMVLLLRAGDVYEARPGVYKVVSYEEE